MFVSFGGFSPLGPEGHQYRVTNLSLTFFIGWVIYYFAVDEHRR